MQSGLLVELIDHLFIGKGLATTSVHTEAENCVLHNGQIAVVISELVP